MMDNSIIYKLIATAIKTRENAYVPYSGFKVGAGLLAADGTIFGGCNVENAAFSPSSCAERTAISTAIAAGHKKFTAIAIVGGKDELADNCFPCGVCRQVFVEFCTPDFLIIVAQNEKSYKAYSLADLLPNSFGPDNLYNVYC